MKQSEQILLVMLNLFWENYVVEHGFWTIFWTLQNMF